jgi:hypothetical protein
MNYIWFYFKFILPKIWFVVTFGIFSPLGWRVDVVDWVLNLFYILDFFIIALYLGKITSCWHHRAFDWFFQMNLHNIANEEKEDWFKYLAFTSYRVLIRPDVF